MTKPPVPGLSGNLRNAGSKAASTIPAGAFAPVSSRKDPDACSVKQAAVRAAGERRGEIGHVPLAAFFPADGAGTGELKATLRVLDDQRSGARQ